LEFRILGPLEAVHDGQVVPLKAAKPRALLALLLLQADELVASDRLIDDLWGGSPPATAAKTLQTYVSQLRRALGSDVILTRPGGYELRLDGRSLDLHRFAELASEAQSLDPPSAARVLREALALWRGPALGEFSYQTWAQHDIRRLEELRLDALERRIDADLATDARPQPLRWRAPPRPRRPAGTRRVWLPPSAPRRVAAPVAAGSGVAVTWCCSECDLDGHLVHRRRHAGVRLEYSKIDMKFSVAVIRYHRALVLEQLGETARAKMDYDRIRQLGIRPGKDLH
jgi:hypothetical protein